MDDGGIGRGDGGVGFAADESREAGGTGRATAANALAALTACTAPARVGGARTLRGVGAPGALGIWVGGCDERPRNGGTLPLLALPGRSGNDGLSASSGWSKMEVRLAGAEGAVRMAGVEGAVGFGAAMAGAVGFGEAMAGTVSGDELRDESVPLLSAASSAIGGAPHRCCRSRAAAESFRVSGTGGAGIAGGAAAGAREAAADAREAAVARDAAETRATATAAVAADETRAEAMCDAARVSCCSIAAF